MNISIPSYSEFESTRDYMQDVAKILGKAQQAYLTEQEHDWHRGLIIDGTQLVSPALEGSAAGKRFALDFESASMETPWGTIELAGKTPTQLQSEIVSLADKSISQPVFTNAEADTYNKDYAVKIMDVFRAINDVLSEFASTIDLGKKSPILVYPHHFDLSLAWFPIGNDEPQYTFGFSTGDTAVPEPYVYILAWPDETVLRGIELPEFAGHETAAFKGILVKISDMQQIDQSEAELRNLFADVIKNT